MYFRFLKEFSQRIRRKNVLTHGGGTTLENRADLIGHNSLAYLSTEKHGENCANDAFHEAEEAFQEDRFAISLQSKFSNKDGKKLKKNL